MQIYVAFHLTLLRLESLANPFPRIGSRSSDLYLHQVTGRQRIPQPTLVNLVARDRRLTVAQPPLQLVILTRAPTKPMAA